MIFTNASSLSDKAAVRTRWYSGEVFNALKPTHFGQIEGWLKKKPAPLVRAVPDPSYQTQVLTDIAATLKDNARATVVMACGTGKTLVALWATEQAKPKTVLVLLPSLMLLQQTLREWSQHMSWGSRFSYLCVCSDRTVGLRGDSIDIEKSDVGFKVDTDPALVRAFLERETADIKMPGIKKPTHIVQIDYVLFTHKGTNSETVYNVTKALATNHPDLVKSMGAFKRQKPGTFGVSTAAPYHPGAIKALTELGLKIGR